MRVTLGSDDPPYFGASIGGEYAVCRERMDFGDEDLREITRTALEAAFCEETLKNDLIRTGRWEGVTARPGSVHREREIRS